MPVLSSTQTHESVDSADTGLRSPDPADWSQLSEPGSLAAWCESWLCIQTEWIGDVTQAVVTRRAADQDDWEWLACSSLAAREALAPLVEATAREGRGLAGPLAEPEPGPLAESSARPQAAGRFGVSYCTRSSSTERATVVVAVEVVRTSESELARVLRQLQWGAAWLEQRLSTSRTAASAATRPDPAEAHRLLDLIALTLEARSFAQASQSLVTQLARELGCDRVSLGVERKGRVELCSLSHSAAFGREMNLVRAIEAAMDEACDQHATLQHPPLSDAAPRILREHEALAREHGAGSVLTIPVGREGTLRGALVFEHGDIDAFERERVEMLETVALAVAPILELWRREDRSLLVKITDAFRVQIGRVVGPGHLGRKAALLGLAAITLFFALAKGDYRIGAQGVLEGESRRVVIAPFDGYVADARLRAGDRVLEGEELARLDDREISLERLKWGSRLLQLERQADESRAAREYARTSIILAQIDEARAEITRLEERLARTRVVAPFDGLVVSGDLSQSLGAAVSRGDVLFEIAPLMRYRVLLEVDEGQIVDVAAGQSGSLRMAAMPGEPLPFEVTKVTPVATAEDGRNFFRVEGILRETSERLRPGMEGVGKIDVDRRRLIWIWTRGFRDWLTLWLWSWWP